MSYTKTVLISTTLLVLLSLATGCQKSNSFVIPDELTSSEYKLILNPVKFSNIEQGFRQYWVIVKKVADENAKGSIEFDDPFGTMKHKQVSFYDTPDHDLRKHGYMLRVKYSFDDAGNLKPGINYSLKYRGKEAAGALAADLHTGEGFTPKYDKIELESDIVYYSAANHAEDLTYSVQNEIDLNNPLGTKYGDFVALYPVLKTFGIDPETPLAPISGLIADEYLYRPGKIDFGSGLFGRIDMSVWKVQVGDSLWLIPEFSYDHPFDADVVISKEAMKLNRAFLNKLRDAAPDWVVPGKLKASYLFEYDAAQRKLD